MSYKTYLFILVVLFMKYYYTNGVCKSLISTISTNITCKYKNTTLKYCINPPDGTEALMSCNAFYEERNIETNLKRLCRDGRWSGFIPECYPVCGKKRNGERTNRSDIQEILLDHPWNVGIYNEDKKLKCGGILINTDIVLTAARCVFDGEKYLVGAGKYYSNYNDPTDKFAQYSEVLKIFIPEKYKGLSNFYESDLAIVILTTPFLLSIVVQPICINMDINPQNAQDLLTNISTLFGYISKNKISGELRETPVSLVKYQICKTKIELSYFTYDKICLSSKINETHSCNFYNGCGLISKNISEDRYYIQGLLSQPWEPETDLCDINLNNLFISITKHIDFVRNHTGYHNKSCLIPSIDLHGEYILNGSNTSYKADDKVPPKSILSLSCYTEYSTSGENQFHCLDGHWTPILKTCQHNPSVPYYVYVIIGIIIFVFAVVLSFYTIKYKNKRKVRQELKLSGLYHFAEGTLKRFNPKLGIVDQAELLPYNYNYEFQSDKLELGEQIGAGTFGTVTKAVAFGIIANEEKTTVAVKMVKKTADRIALKTLISELKILVHLGQHLNVVNLLGACTKDIKNRELFVIVEYCQYGNVHNYLFINRNNYINQIDCESGNIDYSYGSEDEETISADVNNFRNSAENTETISIKSDEELTSPAEDEHCANDSQLKSIRNAEPIRTKDLISWAFQVARGMEYLASRKIIHGDLAARNILLANNGIVKICDFGLSKMLSKRDEYKKLSDSPLPIKWMAIESIQNGVFSSRSDVWSYGIMLWEFFSLSQTPYPGMEDDKRLCTRLLEGYRMESPKYAPKDIYKIMGDCWDGNPLSRPSFNQLAGKVGLMLEENIRQHYIDLNDPYFVMNTQRLIETEQDYLDQLLSDEYRCVNKDNYKSLDIFGYLVVKSSFEELDVTTDDNISQEQTKRKLSISSFDRNSTE